MDTSAPNLTKQQTKTVEDIQRRAVQIIAGNIPDADACKSMGISSLADRRSDLCSKLFLSRSLLLSLAAVRSTILYLFYCVSGACVTVACMFY